MSFLFSSVSYLATFCKLHERMFQWRKANEFARSLSTIPKCVLRIGIVCPPPTMVLLIICFVVYENTYSRAHLQEAWNHTIKIYRAIRALAYLLLNLTSLRLTISHRWWEAEA